MNDQKHKEKKPDGASGGNKGNVGDVSDSFVITGDGNVINVIETKGSSNSPKKKLSPKKRINATIVVALIGLIGTIGTALISAYSKNDSSDPSPTPAPSKSIAFTEQVVPVSIPTDTAFPSVPTSPSMTETETPVPTSTPIPPVALGEDWMGGCISTLWKAYPSTILPEERGDGCWREPVYAFSAENGDLDFLAERGGGPPEVYGLFAPLPESGTVTFTVRLRDLDNVDLWMGVFPQQDVASQGLLMTILNGDVNRRSFVQKDPSNYETVQGTVALNQGNGYSISFVFNTLSVRSRVNPSVFMTNQVSIPTAQKWLFLGYKGLKGAYRVEGTFLNFELKQ
ncbi:MAG: hypothetical protein U0V02_00730 [Anaerolineales bacterium]